MGSRATAESLTVLLTESVGSDGSALQSWVLQALEKKRAGDGTPFQQLVDTVDRNTDLVEQAALVGCLSRCTASLHKRRHSDLTSKVLQRGFRAHEQLTSAVEAFAVNCVSGNADLLASILNELVKHFAKFDLLAATPPETEAEARSRALRNGHLSDTELQEHAQIARDVHRVIQRVLETFPTGTMSFLEQLVQEYPHRVKPVAEQRAYLSNILHVTSYQPQLLPDILAKVTEGLIKIDVEVDPQKLDSLHTGAIDVADDDQLFGLEMEETSEKERKKMLENAEKLDGMMLILLQFFRSIFGERGVGTDFKNNVMKALLATFQAKVLTTYRSKYSQYLIFYACHFHTQYSKDFLTMLILIVVGSEHPDGIRHAAGSYLGSFLARAKYLKLCNVVVTLRLLVTWILEYMDKESAVQGPDPNHHSLFYSLVQSLLYTLCFRLQQLMGADNGKYDTFLRLELRLQDIVLCPLNPLKVIDQAVGNKFVALAVKYRLIQTQVLRDLLEYNKTIIVHGVGEFEEEHSFFPFDPYNLKDSCHLIDGLWQAWVEVSSDDVFSEDEAAASGWGRDVDGSDGASESIAMSLTSQLSLSDHNQHSGDASPASNWRPMSFSPSGAVDVNNPLHRGMR